jgi:DNA-binding CsgD family transcriptional regulator
MSAAALTPRQAEIVERVSRGATSKEIGAALGITERAVKAQLSRLYGRFGAPNRAGLIATVLAHPELVAHGVPDAVAALEDPAAFAHYEGAPFLVAMTRGPRHVFAFVNARVRAVMGPPGGAMVGRSIHEVCPDPPERIVAMDVAYASGEVRSLPNNRVGGLLVNTIFQPLRRGDGAVRGLLMICTDAAID